MSQRYTDTRRRELTERVLVLMPTMSMREACKARDVAPTTFRQWIDSDDELQAQYARAREDYHDYLAQQILDIANEPPERTTDKGNVDNGSVQDKRVRIDALRWTLSKVAPKKYGDRVTLAGDADAPLNTVVNVTHEIVDKTKYSMIKGGTPSNDEAGDE